MGIEPNTLGHWSFDGIRRHFARCTVGRCKEKIPADTAKTV